MVPQMVANCFPKVNSDSRDLEGVASCYYLSMTSDEIRLTNLKALIKIAGGTPATLEQYCAARGIKVSWKYISQILNGFQGEKDRKPRTLGSDVARRLEKAFCKSSGWMDNNHDSKNTVHEPEASRLPPATLSKDETTVLNAFRILPDDLRENWLMTAKLHLDRQRKNSKKSAA